LTTSDSTPASGKPGQPGQVDRGLGVPGAAQHAALGVAKREHVPRADQVRRGGGRSGSLEMVVARSAAEMPV
jgi:hypothetical protein